MLGPFPCAALQNRLTTAFCHCSDIYWYLPFTQAWIEKPLKSCSSALFSGLLDRQCLVSSPVLLCKTSWQQFFVTAMTPIDMCFHTSLDRETTKELQQCWTVSAWSLPLCCSAKQADNSFLSLQRHILVFAFYTSLDEETTKELQQCWTDSAWSLPLCCSAKQAGNSFLSLQ